MSPEIALFRINDDVVFTELDGEFVVLQVESGIYYGLDEVGVAIWTYLQEGRTFKEIVECIQQDYDVSAEQLTEDVKELIATLQRENLIVRL